MWDETERRWVPGRLAAIAFYGAPAEENIHPTENPNTTPASILATPIQLAHDFQVGDLLDVEFVCVPVNTSGGALGIVAQLLINGESALSFSSWSVPHLGSATVHGRVVGTVGGRCAGSLLTMGSTNSAVVRTSNGILPADPETIDVAVVMAFGGTEENWYVDSTASFCAGHLAAIPGS